jgi:hypothetical protein
MFFICLQFDYLLKVVPAEHGTIVAATICSLQIKHQTTGGARNDTTAKALSGILGIL